MRQVTAAVIVEDGRLFIARRSPGGSLGGLWELPGGKLEEGETPQECLVRELDEELGMSATAGRVLARTVYHYEHGSFELLALETTRLSVFELRVHDKFAWVDSDVITSYPLAPADLQLIAQISKLDASPG